MIRFKNVLVFVFSILFSQIATSQINDNSWRSISGDKYDYTKTMMPEQCYMNEYHQMQLMKIMMAIPDGKGGSIVKYNFEEVLSIVKRMDNLSRGLKKVLFLVGWQYNGHDDKYPAWHEVNNALKRPQDGTGRESLLWLAAEAKKYNTYISVHVNMTDAYKASPFWNDYFDKGLISRNSDGTPMQIGEWNNQKAYQVCYTKEWESGYSVKRINDLLELLPFIKDAGTIMLDAFFCRDNPYEKITAAQEESYQRKISRYFRSCGIDVTHESFMRERDKKDLFIGINPWYLWFDTNESNYMKYPASLATGGASYLFVKQAPKFAQEQLDLGFLFGMSGRGEDCFGNIEDNSTPIPDWEKKYRFQFYTGTLPYVYLNRLSRLKIEGKEKNRVVYFSSNVVSSLKDSTIVRNKVVLRDKNDVFMPNLWKAEREIISYSEKGYNDKYWVLPEDWADVKAVDVYRITASGLQFRYSTIVESKGIKLSLGKDEAVSVFPASGKKKTN